LQKAKAEAEAEARAKQPVSLKKSRRTQDSGRRTGLWNLRVYVPTTFRFHFHKNAFANFITKSESAGIK